MAMYESPGKQKNLKIKFFIVNFKIKFDLVFCHQLTQLLIKKRIVIILIFPFQ